MRAVDGFVSMLRSCAFGDIYCAPDGGRDSIPDISNRSQPARRAVLTAGFCLALAGCSGPGLTPGVSGRGFGPAPEQAELSPAQACAIGYDMSRKIYQLARVGDTTVRVSPDLGPCGRHAARYLRQAGFAVDETATRRDAYVFAIRTYEDPETDRVIATAALPGLQLTRAYRRAGFGVTAASAFTVITSLPGDRS